MTDQLMGEGIAEGLLKRQGADFLYEVTAETDLRRGVDYAWHGDINPQEFLTNGYSFICRYLSHNPSKDITLEEAKMLSAAGLDIVLVWETTEQRALADYDAGHSDASEAFARAEAAGMPHGRPVYFAIDTDATGEAVEAYFHGVNDASGPDINRIGAYGGIKPLTYLADAGLIKYLWQTSAWSNSKWEPRSHLQQFKYGVTICGADCDINRAMFDDFGQWRIGAAPEPPIPPLPTTHRTLTVTSPLMTGGDVIWLQKKLCVISFPVQIDGKYGNETAGAIKKFQELKQLSVVGICGPKTWAKLFNS